MYVLNSSSIFGMYSICLLLCRNQQSQLQAELESQIGISREQLQAYEGIAGPDYNQLVKEYGRILDEIEDHKWALQQASTDND